MWRPGLDPKDYAVIQEVRQIELRAEMHRWISYAVSIVVSIVTAYLTSRWTVGK